MKNITLKIAEINSDKDLEKAFDRIDVLMDKKRTKTEDIEFNILSLLIEQYEDKHYPIDTPDPILLLKDIMEDRGWKTKDLGNLLGHKSLASEILNRKRKMSLNVIKILHNEFCIPFDILMIGEKDYGMGA